MPTPVPASAKLLSLMATRVSFDIAASPSRSWLKNPRFIETAYLIIYGHLPNHAELRHFSDLFTEYQFLHEDMKYHFENFPTTAHPMAILSAMINATSCFDEGLMHWQWGKANSQFDTYAAKLMSQVRTIAAYSYRKSQGLPLIYPKKSYKYTANFLHMMFSSPYEDFEIKPEMVKALDLIFLLHADHEQNCSTSTVRMVASSPGEPFCQRFRRCLRLLGAVARRRQPGRPGNARRNPSDRR